MKTIIKKKGDKSTSRNLKLKLIPILIFVFMYSCGNKTKDNHEHKQIEKVEQTDEHNHTENSLVLDNGKLWIANPETTTGINNMINIMNSFSDKSNVEAYGKLTENLKEEFTMIIQKCTMTGEAHNQLHIFLVPIKDVFETLGSSDLKQCQDSYRKLTKHLGEYKKFFK